MDEIEIQEDLESKKEQLSEEQLEAELKKFNWGAAYFGIIWSAVNRCFKKWFLYSTVVGLIFAAVAYGVMFLLNLINPELFMMYTIFGSFFIPLFIILVIFIYSGINGNRWAWESDAYKDITAFQKNQKIWGIVAGVFMFFTVLGWLINAGFFLFLINSSDDENLDNYKTYISAEGCTTFAKILPEVINNVKDDGNWLLHLGEELEKNKKINSAIGLDYIRKLTVNLEVNGNPEKIDFDVVREKPCTLTEANCYISAPVKDSNKACRFYIGDNGEVVASKKTNLFITKQD